MSGNRKSKGQRPNRNLLTSGNAFKLKGRTLVVQAPAATLCQVNLSPIATAFNLGSYSARLASEADLWQEYRFTKLSFHNLCGFESTNNAAAATAVPVNNECYVMGFSNVTPNAAPTTAAQILEMPTSHMCFNHAVSVTPECSNFPTHMVVPARDLRPAFVPWLKTVASTGGADFTIQGYFYGLFNYVVTSSVNVQVYVQWEIEFRNPVPAVETIVLRRTSELGLAVASFIDERKEAEEHDSQWSDAAHEKAAPCPTDDRRRVPSLRSGKR